jgi:hypothetical protein
MRVVISLRGESSIAWHVELLRAAGTDCTCELNSSETEKFFKKNQKRIKYLLAMKINSGTNGGGASRGSISRSYEGVGKNPSVYPYFERLFRPAVRGCRLSVRRVGGERARFA